MCDIESLFIFYILFIFKSYQANTFELDELLAASSILKCIDSFNLFCSVAFIRENDCVHTEIHFTFKTYEKIYSSSLVTSFSSIIFNNVMQHMFVHKKSMQIELKIWIHASIIDLFIILSSIGRRKKNAIASTKQHYFVNGFIWKDRENAFIESINGLEKVIKSIREWSQH